MLRPQREEILNETRLAFFQTFSDTIGNLFIYLHLGFNWPEYIESIINSYLTEPDVAEHNSLDNGPTD